MPCPTCTVAPCTSYSVEAHARCVFASRAPAATGPAASRWIGAACARPIYWCSGATVTGAFTVENSRPALRRIRTTRVSVRLSFGAGFRRVTLRRVARVTDFIGRTAANDRLRRAEVQPGVSRRCRDLRVPRTETRRPRAMLRCLHGSRERRRRVQRRSRPTTSRTACSG